MSEVANEGKEIVKMLAKMRGEAVDELAAKVGAEAADLFVQMLDEGTLTLKAAKGITGEEMDAVYSLAHDFYRTGRYQDAETLFKFLTVYDHLNPRYWLGLGATRQVQRRFEEAIKAYALVSLTLDVKNLKAPYYAAECFLALGDREKARQALDHVKHYCDAKTEAGRTMLAKVARLEKLAAGGEGGA